MPLEFIEKVSLNCSKGVHKLYAKYKHFNSIQKRWVVNRSLFGANTSKYVRPSRHMNYQGKTETWEITAYSSRKNLKKSNKQPKTVRYKDDCIRLHQCYKRESTTLSDPDKNLIKPLIIAIMVFLIASQIPTRAGLHWKF